MRMHEASGTLLRLPSGGLKNSSTRASVLYHVCRQSAEFLKRATKENLDGLDDQEQMVLRVQLRQYMAGHVSG